MIVLGPNRANTIALCSTPGAPRTHHAEALPWRGGRAGLPGAPTPNRPAADTRHVRGAMPAFEYELPFLSSWEPRPTNRRWDTPTPKYRLAFPTPTGLFGRITGGAGEGTPWRRPAGPVRRRDEAPASRCRLSLDLPPRNGWRRAGPGSAGRAPRAGPTAGPGRCEEHSGLTVRSGRQRDG